MMDAKAVISTLAGDLLELLDIADLADDVRTKLTEQLAGDANPQDLAISITTGVISLARLAK